MDQNEEGQYSIGCTVVTSMFKERSDGAFVKVSSLIYDTLILYVHVELSMCLLLMKWNDWQHVYRSTVLYTWTRNEKSVIMIVSGTVQ